MTVASSSDERSFNDTVQGIGFVWRGTTSFANHVALPVMDAVAGNLREAGLGRALDEPRFPQGEGRETILPRADLVGLPLLVGFTIFVGSSIGSWAIGRLADDIWDNRVKPALKQWRESRQTDDDRFRDPFEFRVTSHFAGDDLRVVVTTIVSSERDLEDLERLAPEAQRRALAWVGQNGITGRELIYTLKNGELSSFPRVN